MKKRYLIALLAVMLVGNYCVPDLAAHGYVEWSVNDNTAKVTRFYPNPATTVINFEFDKSVDRSYSLHICSFIGKKMAELRITETKKLAINLDDQYYRGLYVYQLRDQNNRIVESGKFQVVK